MSPQRCAVSGLSIMLITIGATATGAAADPARTTDVYDSYAELAHHETEGVDYRRRWSLDGTGAVHVAIHGGKIEYPTTKFAEYGSNAGSHSFYTFEGIMPDDNMRLHITSTKFDEPIALDIVGDHRCAVSWHGFTDDRELTYVGGLDKELRNGVRKELESAGFEAPSSIPDEYAGTSPDNIVNKNATERGVQLEISSAQRDALMRNGRPIEAFDRYVDTVERAVDARGC